MLVACWVHDYIPYHRTTPEASPALLPRFSLPPTKADLWSCECLVECLALRCGYGASTRKRAAAVRDALI